MKEMFNNDIICSNISVGDNGHLFFAGQDTLELAREYGTPLYLMDEDRIRHNCGVYRDGAERAFGRGGYKILYASKAASFRHIYRIMQEEGMGIDVVSKGEIHTAVSAGYDMSGAYFHSNNKTDDDINYAMDSKVGYFVVDTAEELEAIDRIAAERGIIQKLLLRITPGIDPHTFEQVATGKVDSKFGSAIETGQAEEIAGKALLLGHIALKGFHCHVGSQVFDSDVFFRSADIMIDFIADFGKKTGFHTEELNLGGGYGVRYTEKDPFIDIADNIRQVKEHVAKKCDERNIKMPVIIFEPGRSVVADAGMTLYTVGSLKKITGFSNYVSVDGGMTDNPRYALYRSEYTVLPAYDMNAKRDMVCNIVGRCCESGDIIQPDISMPADIRRGDIIAVLTTGAYNYSMASNYNRIGRPPVVMLKDGDSRVVVRREEPEDLVILDV